MESRFSVFGIHFFYGSVAFVEQLQQAVPARHALQGHHQRAVLVYGRNANTLFVLPGNPSVDVCKGSRIHLKTVFMSRIPRTDKFQGTRSARLSTELILRPIPQGINLFVEMNPGRIGLFYRRRHFKRRVLVRVHLRGDIKLHLQGCCGHLRLIAFPPFPGLLLFLLPLVVFLLPTLQTTGVWNLREYLQRVALRNKPSHTVGRIVSNLHTQRVLVDKSGVTEPVGDGVLVQTGFRDESIPGIEIEALYLRQVGIAIAEKECEVIGFLAFSLQEEAVGLRGSKGVQHHIVRKEMCIRRLHDVLDMQRIGPERVLPYVRFPGRHDDFGREGDPFTLLVVHVIAVSILQRIDTVVSLSNTPYDEVAAAVGTRDTQHGLFQESRVVLVAVKAHENALDGFQVLGIKHIARHFERVDMVAGGEAVGIVSQRVSLVVVGDGIREVDGVSGVRLQLVLQAYCNLLPGGLDFRCFQLRRRHDDLLRGVLQLDELVEVDAHLPAVHIGSTLGRRCPEHSGWCLVVPAAIGLSHLGTGNKEEK